MAHEHYQGTHKGGGYNGSSKNMGKSYGSSSKGTPGGAWGYHTFGTGKVGMHRRMKMRYGEELFSGVKSYGTGY